MRQASSIETHLIGVEDAVIGDVGEGAVPRGDDVLKHVAVVAELLDPDVHCKGPLPAPTHPLNRQAGTCACIPPSNTGQVGTSACSPVSATLAMFTLQQPALGMSEHILCMCTEKIRRVLQQQLLAAAVMVVGNIHLLQEHTSSH